jgi:AraC-like DNA-binding protein
MKESRLCSEKQSQWLYANTNNHYLEKHFHDTYSIGIILSGVCEFSLDDKDYQAIEGDVVVLNPYQVHNGGGKDKPIEYHMFYPTLEMMQSIVGKGNYYPLFTHPIIKNRKLLAQVNEVISRHQNRVIDSQDVVCEKIIRLLLDSIPTEFRILTPPNKILGLVGKVCQFIESQLYYDLSVAHIAEHFSVSRWHLAKIFKHKVGLSPNQYVRLLRLREAQKLIEKGTPLIQVSSDLLFADQAHFCREFKRTTGLSPGKVVV